MGWSRRYLYVNHVKSNPPASSLHKKSEPTPRIHRMCFFSWVGRVCRLELPPIPPGIDLLLFAARGAHA